MSMEKEREKTPTSNSHSGQVSYPGICRIHLPEMVIGEHSISSLVLETTFFCKGKKDILRKVPSRKWGQNLVKRKIRK